MNSKEAFEEWAESGKGSYIDAEAAWQAAQPKWISVEDRLPEKEGLYICYFSDGCIETFYYEPDDKFNPMWGVHNVVVTHWQPLPASPEEDDE